MSESRFKLDRRRTVVVDRAMQWRIILSVSAPMLVILALVLGAQMVFDYNVRKGTLDVDGTVLGLPERSLSAVLFFGFATLYHVIHALKVSQKIAGAAYRMRQVLGAYRDGDKSIRIKLRDGDLHMELADDINATLDWVGQDAGQFAGGAPREAVLEAEKLSTLS